MKKYIIVGTGWAGQAIAEELIKKNGDGSLVGFIDDLTINSEVSVLGKSIPFLGKAEDITNISKSFNVKDIILAVSCDQSDEILKQIVKCQEVGVMIHEMPEIYSKIAKKC